MDTIRVRPLTSADAVTIPRAFAAAGWKGKETGTFVRYLAEQAARTRSVFVASFDDEFAGYLTVKWNSTYPPFRESGVPEIQDLNVLAHLRRRHVASTLMDTAEAAIGARGDTAGIGVGLYAAYAAAHRMYLQRGYLPDGYGVVYQGAAVQPGVTVRVDDDLVLMMTRRLRKTGRRSHG